MSKSSLLPAAPVGLVLDHSSSGGDATIRVRVKGFRSADKSGPKRNPGLVYLVPVKGGAQNEDQLPSELKDISVTKFWELVNEGRLVVIDSP
jgi:hypothetical protein